MIYYVTNRRNGFELMQRFTDYDSALEFYRHECAEIGGPVVLTRRAYEANSHVDVMLHSTRGA